MNKNLCTDEEEVILNAFAQYDEGDGLCKEETLVQYLLMNEFHNDLILFTLIISLRHALVTWGEKFSQQEVIENKIRV